MTKSNTSSTSAKKAKNNAPNPPYVHRELFTGLTFNRGEHSFTLRSQDIIKIAMEITQEAESSLDSSLCSVVIQQAPNVAEEFLMLSATVLAIYSLEYGFPANTLYNFVSNVETSPNNLFYRREYMPMLSYIREHKSHIRSSGNYISDGVVTKFLPSPNPIRGMRTIYDWMSLVKELRAGPSSQQTNGWWLLLSNHLIHLNYNHHSTTQQFYVSDHGPIEEIHAQTESAIFSHTYAERSTLDLAIIKFLKFYDSLSESHQELLRLNFIKKATSYDPMDREMMELLVFSFAYPAGLRNTIIHERALKWPTMIAPTSDTLIPTLTEEEAENIQSKENYNTYLQVFETTIERFRYLRSVVANGYYKFLFENAGTVTQTQYHNIMSKKDADNYLKCKLLANLADLVHRGNRKYSELPIIYRPVTSYGDRENGAAYTHFARDIEKYLKSETSIGEQGLATAMRNILCGNSIDVSEFPFIPNLAAAWFVSEAIRNRLSIMTSLILLDLIENGQTLPTADKENWYSWRNSLIHPKYGTKPKVKRVEDLYGDITKKDDKGKERQLGPDGFGGIHPMVHGGSVRESRQTLEDIERGEKLSIVRQKEASLMLHWLYIKLAERGITCSLITKQEAVLTGESPSVNLEGIAEINIIKDLLTQRLSCLDNMLAQQQELDLIQQVEASGAEETKFADIISNRANNRHNYIA